MKPCLADVNVALAMCYAGHQHHLEAREFGALLGEAGLKICRVVQLGLLRLLCNRHVMSGREMNTPEAWGILSAFMQSVRTSYIDEPPGLLDWMTEHTKIPGVGPNFWTDAYLAAFAASSGLSLATFDQGFRKFNVPLYLLGARRN